MVARLLVLVAGLTVGADFALPAAAQAVPVILAAAPSPSVSPSSCEADGADAAVTTIGCRLVVAPQVAQGPLVVRIVLDRPERRCPGATVIDVGSNGHVRLPIVEQGASRSARACQP